MKFPRQVHRIICTDSGTSVYYQCEPHGGIVPITSARVTPTGSDGLPVVVANSCDSLREQVHSTSCTVLGSLQEGTSLLRKHHTCMTDVI